MNESEIKQKTIVGTIWKFLERIIAKATSLVVSIIIARILDPSDYGVVSIVAIFFVFADVLITGGLNTALIQKKDADSKDYSTVLISSIFVAVLCYVLLFVFAPFISRQYRLPLLCPVIRVMSLTLIISAVKSVWCAYTSSTLQFKKFFMSTIGGTVISAFVGIGMAMKGFGPWALVAQQMTNNAIDTLILMLSVKIKMKAQFSFARFKQLFNYSWKILVSTLVGTTYTQVVPLFIGIRYSSRDLSFYTKGQQLPETITYSVTETLSSILFPVLAKFQDQKDKLLSYTRLFMRLTSYIEFPVLLGFFAVADNFVSVVLTDKWLPAVYYLRMFCLLNMFSMIHIGNCETIKAMGRSDVYLIIEIIKKVCYFSVIAVFVLFSHSPKTLVLAFVINEIVAIVVNSIPNVKLIDYKIRHQLADLVPNLVTASIMAGVVMLVGILNINKLVLLAVQIITGGIVYVLISLVTRNQSFYYSLDLVKGYLFKQNKA